ncbi:MFS monocarboxylate [Colletotrichum sp. SAR 10_99]|nr:MFS monocarboxylate [Colletotrichum sp. SAR 10_96]KAI8294557.1 MFS monocarboxylate [Colletotrichum sp. SAR 10_98]KAJ5010833.1 MFS monocarboxylate [Colletotrichum sp. SAR 10_99]
MGNSEEQARPTSAPTSAPPPSVRSGSSQRDPESSPLAWVCVVGSFMFLYPSYGFMQSVGTVQSYLQLNQLSDYTARDLGWISGIFTSLGLLLGIQAGPLMDAYGTRLLAPISAATLVPLFFLLGECTEYWHFILCLGVLGGISSALTSTVAMAVIGKLFSRRRGLAMGLALSGSSFGGVTLSMMFRSLLPKLGWQWTMRATGFLVLGIMVLGVICFLPFPTLTASSSSAPLGGKGATLNFSAFKSPPFDFMTMGLFLLEFVLFGITGLLPTFAIVAGFPSSVGFSLIAILNGCSCFGRIVSGMAGDRLGHLNDYGRYLGTMNFVVSFSLLITVPIGGQMLESMGGTALSGFYVAVLFLGGVSYFAGRSLLVGGWFTFRTRI